MHQEIKKWLQDTNTLDQLIKYVNLRSRSNFPEEVKLCADYNSKLLENLGLNVEIIETSGNPVVFGKKIGTNDRSVMIYGHYDVQHEGDLELWDSEPFKAEVRGDKLFGRGTADNKGQHFAHIKALEYLKLKYPDDFEKLSVSVILDGDEERGSFSLPEVFEKRKEDLKAEIMIVSDGPSLVYDAPTIVGSVRGIVTFQITIKNNPEDLHSGNFGGFARTSSLDMIHLLSEMIDSSGRARVPGFYDDVIEPSDFEKEKLEDLKPIYDEIGNARGFNRAVEQDGMNVYDQNQFWPTININGIQSGGVRKERRTIIPAEIVASIDCRLVPNMKSSDIKSKIENFVSNWAKERGIEDKVTISSEHAMEPVYSSLNDPNVHLIQKALRFGFEKEPVLVPRLGGSLPLYVFPKYLDKDVFLVPLALPDENNHSPNENLDLPYFEKGIISMVKFYQLIVE